MMDIVDRLEVEAKTSEELNPGDSDIETKRLAADEIKRLRHALDKIAFATGAMPEAWNDERSWFRSQFYDCVATAARALGPAPPIEPEPT